MATCAWWRTRPGDAGARYAVRCLRALFTAGAVLTLGIGLAANATMFGVVTGCCCVPASRA
jgi:hypothetical protein